MIYMHNRVVTINSLGKTPDLTPEFCEALGRAIMWGLPDPTTGSEDTVDNVHVCLQSKDVYLRFSNISPDLLSGLVIEPMTKEETRLVMGVVQHHGGSWSLNT